MRQRIAGRIPVLECLRAGKRAPRRLFVLPSAQGMDGILDAAAGVPIETRPRAELDQLADGTVHQGVVLEADPLPVLCEKDWLAQSLPADALAVVLDGIEDPHNFGAIVRSASALGAHGVFFAKRHAAPLSAAALKSAAGAMSYIDLVEVTNITRALGTLKKAGFWVAGFDADAPQTLWQADLSGRLAVVIGSEGAGMRRLVQETCDFLVRIPLTGAITSLNASVSAAIALAECRRRRAGDSGP
ncbi:MAG TPA: 23S rRNA (guanosine(2251)-2'-O)-methyltransferase RlmB [Candidatus Hydrogenedentes bacterium]|nr:23S rRNA (guanosine(2251)-2'-O)-methyltransferase RlmB [Candidatus Hydrogenedentota bacterium]